MVQWLADGTATSVLQTAAAVLVYALIVNGFYQVISKRRMFVKRVDIEAEKQIEEAMRDAKHGAKEVKVLAQDGIKDVETRETVAHVAQETADAVKTAEKEIKAQVVQGFSVMREVRALVLFPLVGFLFFILLSANLIFLGSSRPPLEVFGLSMAILLAVRVAAYISEPTAHDLAKMLPLALLGFFIIQGDFVDIAEGNRALRVLLDEWLVIVSFLVLSTIVETGLRISYLVLRWLKWTTWLAQRTKRFRH